MEGRFQFGYCIRMAGPSQCGKTSSLCKLLESKSFFYPCPPKRIMWVTGSRTKDEKLEAKITRLYPNSQFFYDVSKDDDFSDMVEEFDLWVFDDLSSEFKKNSSFTNFFTKIAHHKNCLMVYLTQNAYEDGPDATTRARNCAYQIFFSNKSDQRFIRVLGDQLINDAKTFSRMFDKATKRPYDCLLCDNRVSTPK